MALEQRVPPNQSLYIRNLPDKLQKEDLRRELYILFATYGPILDVTALKTSRMRGQAHVLFRDVQAASQAMRACQGFDFFGREMKINYAKARSLTLQKMTGNFAAPASTLEQAQHVTASTFVPPPGAAPSSIQSGPPINRSAPSVNLPKQPAVNGLVAPPALLPDAPSPQGVKRQREESDEEAPMEEDGDDDDGEGEMDMSDDD